MALRGTFLVGGRPAADDLVRRFVLCAAESGIDVFRMHDPLNDIDDLAVPAAAVREAGARLYAGLVYSDGARGPRLPARARAPRCPTWAPTASCCTTPPARSTRPARAS